MPSQPVVMNLRSRLEERALHLLAQADPDQKPQDKTDALRTLREADLLAGKVPLEPDSQFCREAFGENGALDRVLRVDRLAADNALGAETVSEMAGALVPRSPRE